MARKKIKKNFSELHECFITISHVLLLIRPDLAIVKALFLLFLENLSAEYSDNGRCHSCHSTCETCMGPTESDCLTCSNNLLLQNNKCVNTCDKGYFMEAGICTPCLHTCTQCVSRMNCTECVKGLQLQSGECRATCADG